MDVIQKAFAPKERNSTAMATFGLRLRGQFNTNKAYRRPKELQWIEDLRAYKGIYDPGVKIETGNSRVYPKITRSKVNIVLSRLHEMLFPEIDKNWEISPTPEPSMSKETVRQIALSLVTQDPQTGAYKPPTELELNIAIKDYAKDTCARMSSEIDDQLTEMEYPEETKKVLRSGLMYGTGIMKGPMTQGRMKRRWAPTEDGRDYEELVEKDEVPDLEFVRIWDWYPDMSVVDIQQIEGSFQRHLMNKHDLRGLMKRDDFFADEIGAYLTTYKDGDWTPGNWETDLQVIEIEAGNTGSGSSQTSTLEEGATSRMTGKKYEVLEFWGYVDGAELEACGINVDDPELEYGANVHLLGNKIIKAVLFDGALDQYKVFYYEKDETSLFGEGLARIMRHSQISISAGARMVLDNGACVAGPQVEVNWSLMTKGTDMTSFYPRKIWYRKGTGVDAQYPALRVYNIDSHVDELLKIVDAFKQFADEETTLPTWMIGQMVNNETAQATSGRMGTITISIKDVVKNFDTFTEKVIRDMYGWNMDWNKRKDIKGDYAIKARGVSSLVMKEVRMQALNQLSTTLRPDELDYIPAREMLSEKFKAHDLTIKLLTEEEVTKLRENRENSMQRQLELEMARSEIAKNRAQAASLLTKAKDKNVEATIKGQAPPEGTQTTDPRIAEGELAILQTQKQALEAEIARKEEAHRQMMDLKEEEQATKLAVQKTKTSHEVAALDKKTEKDLEIADEKAKADIKIKEESGKASAEAKKIAAKKKPAVKPAKIAK